MEWNSVQDMVRATEMCIALAQYGPVKREGNTHL